MQILYHTPGNLKRETFLLPSPKAGGEFYRKERGRVDKCIFLEYNAKECNGKPIPCVDFGTGVCYEEIGENGKEAFFES